MPTVARRKALTVGAGRWIDDLPMLVQSLEREWTMTVGSAYGDATEAFVARATLRDGTPAVLKLVIPRSGEAAHHEITVLRLAGGEGCVRLLRSDARRGALLLERLGRSLHDLALLLAEAEYDMGILMREDPRELLDGDPHERARRLARHTGLDATAIWEWGVVERVSTGLWCTQIGLQPTGRQMLAAADRLAE